VLRRSAFIVPCSPVQRGRPPVGNDWLHEVKFDGWRIQLHKNGRGAVIYTRNGNDFTRRFPALAAAVASLPVRSAIIDGELVANNDRGLPDFRALHFHDVHDDELCVWAFDLLQVNGVDLRPAPLRQRKYALEKLVYKTRDNWLRLSENLRRRYEAALVVRAHGP
jgi:bifunctional non-homologous end joining protein LigD